MRSRQMTTLLLLIGITINAQTINLHGKVSNSAGKPISDAVVRLVGQNLTDTTGSDGTYAIATTGTGQSLSSRPQRRLISFDNGILTFSVPTASPVKIELLDVNGTLLKSVVTPNPQAGFYRYNVAENTRAPRLLVINASIGNEKQTFRYLPLGNGTPVMHQSVENERAAGDRLAKIAAVDDTLNVAADGYAPKATAITSYDQELDIILDTADGTGHSAGCGTDPVLQKSTPPPNTKMNYNYVTIQGTRRQYLLWYPDNYDNTHPYRLVICYHWYSGSASQVFDCRTEGINCYTTQIPFFNLLDISNNSTIFVAPDGIDAGWANTNNRDLEFTDSILAQVQKNFCIDTARIFACGFSYGGAMSYAIACSRAPVFRAVAVYAGGAMSGGNADSKIPIAYYASHGIDDSGIGSGRTARDHFLEVNGCTPEDAPEPSRGSGTHICTKYSGCSSGHPVEWCAFDGGHDPSPKDRGKSSTWNAPETWEFFTQF